MQERKYENRVELHCHTCYSRMDGVASVKDIINFAKCNDISAVAFTDNGNVSAYPDIQYHSADNPGFKPIYGLEAYVVDDIDAVGKNLDEVSWYTLPTDVVVVDIETTGFSSQIDEIIEIGAVRICDGKPNETFERLVKPAQSIPAKISELTGIDDRMIKDADPIEVVLPELLSFIGDAVIVGHNVRFDLDFISENAGRLGMEFHFQSIDTLALSRSLLPSLDSYRLDSVAKACGISMDRRHRAVDDATATAGVYLKLIDIILAEGISNIGEMVRFVTDREEQLRNGRTDQLSILAKNRPGLETIYKLITESNKKDIKDVPKIRLSTLLANRENLLIGSGCDNGMISRMIRGSGKQEDIEAAAALFDYIEIQPLSELRWMINRDTEDTIESEEDIIAYNDRILAIGEKLHKPVVAVSNAYYLRPENAVSRKILWNEQHYIDPASAENMHFRTTDEMLTEFDYLGDDKAYEIVIENPNKILEQIDSCTPILYPAWYPKLKYDHPGDFEKLEELCSNNLKRLYGENHKAAEERLQKELGYIKENGSTHTYLYYYELIQKNNLHPSRYSLRGSASAMLVCYLLGISHADPLDADVPLYSEFFIDIGGTKRPDIDLNVDTKVWKDVVESVRTFPGVKTIYKAGTIECLNWEEIDFMIRNYEDNVQKIPDEQKMSVRYDLSHVFCKRGSHAGGVIIIPEGVDEAIIAPWGYDDDRTEKTLQFDYHSMDHVFEKLDILPSEYCSVNARMYEETGYYPTAADIRSDEIMSLVTDCSGLGILEEKNNTTRLGILGVPCSIGLLGVPYFINGFNLMLAENLMPQNTAELVMLLGLCRGSGTWLKNGEILFEKGRASLKDMISCREDVYEMMMSCGMDKKTAFYVTDCVRKGKMRLDKYRPELENLMREYKVPEWYIWSCERIAYLFSRAYLAECIQEGLRALYYKLHYPEKYYPVIFEICGTEKVRELYAKGEEKFIDELEHYLESDENASGEDVYFYKVWDEYSFRREHLSSIHEGGSK